MFLRRIIIISLILSAHTTYSSNKRSVVMPEIVSCPAYYCHNLNESECKEQKPICKKEGVTCVVSCTNTEGHCMPCHYDINQPHPKEPEKKSEEKESKPIEKSKPISKNQDLQNKETVESSNQN